MFDFEENCFCELEPHSDKATSPINVKTLDWKVHRHHGQGVFAACSCCSQGSGTLDLNECTTLQVAMRIVNWSACLLHQRCPLQDDSWPHVKASKSLEGILSNCGGWPHTLVL